VDSYDCLILGLRLDPHRLQAVSLSHDFSISISRSNKGCIIPAIPIIICYS
jgi:hypothetical protein